MDIIIQFTQPKYAKELCRYLDNVGVEYGVLGMRQTIVMVRECNHIRRTQDGNLIFEHNGKWWACRGIGMWEMSISCPEK